MSEHGLPCIVCGEALTNVAPAVTVNQPNDGLAAAERIEKLLQR